MTEIEYKYAAFISYRHTQLDKKWAKWLAEKLERYRVPKYLVETGHVKKLGKIYRDEDEFTAVPNLHEHIKKALEHSSHLIVICSSNTPESRWVDQEIEYFRSLGRNDKILLLLVDGEPKDSFPKPLWKTDQNGNIIEPVAADVRPNEGKKKNQLRENALLRLIAPMLECEFDQLKQREKIRESARKLKWSLAIILVIVSIALLIVWSQYRNAIQADKATQTSLTNQSNLLSSFADRESKNQNHTKALALALEGLNHDPKYLGDRGTAIDRIIRESDLIREHTVFGQHKFSVTDVTFSPNGTQVLSTDIKNAIIWDAFTGELLANFEGHGRTFFQGEFNHNGKYIVTTSADGSTARIWDTKTEDEYFKCNHEKRVTSAKFSYDGKLVASASVDGTVKIWDVTAKKLLHTLVINPTAIDSHPLGQKPEAFFTSDGKHLISNFGGTEIDVWNPITGNPISQIRGHSGTIISAVSSEDGKLLVTTSTDNTARVWELESGLELQGFSATNGQEITSADFSPDSKQVVYVTQNGVVEIKSARTGRDRGQFTTGDVEGVFLVKISPDNKTIATLSYDGVLRTWGKETLEPLFSLNGHDDFIRDFEFSHDSNYVTTSSNDGTARLWDIRHRRNSLHIPEENGFDSIVGFNNGENFLTTSWDGSIKMWNSQTATELKRFEGHEKKINSIDVSKDTNYIVTSSDDTTVRLWGAHNTIKELKVFSDHLQKVNTVFFNRESNAIITSSDDQTVRIIDLTNDKVIVLDHDDEKVRSAVFSPDGKQALTSTWGAVYLWDIHKQQKLYSFEQFSEFGINPASFSPDGNYIVIPVDNGHAYVLNAETLAQVSLLKAHKNSAVMAEFSPDSKFLATASFDKTARIWEVKTGRLVSTLTGHENAVSAIRFTPQGDLIATISDDRTMRLWNPKTGVQLSASRKFFRRINDFIFSDDGEKIFIATEDGAQVWSRNYLTGKSHKSFVNGNHRDWVFAAGAKILPRCLSPEERQAYNLPPDPPCWCQEKKYPTEDIWEEDYKKRRENTSRKKSKLLRNNSDESPFTAVRNDGWTCPKTGMGYSAPWNEFSDLKNLKKSDLYR